MATSPKPTSKTPLTASAVARVQGAVARQHQGQVPKGSYVGRLQSTLEKQGGNNGGKK